MCVWTDEQLAIPIKKLQEAIKPVQEGMFIPDREKDEMTEALENPEHLGRTRGTPGSVPWVHRFPDIGGYRSRERKGNAEATKMQRLTARLAKLEDPCLDAAQEATQPS